MSQRNKWKVILEWLFLLVALLTVNGLLRIAIWGQIQKYDGYEATRVSWAEVVVRIRYDDGCTWVGKERFGYEDDVWAENCETNRAKLMGWYAVKSYIDLYAGHEWPPLTSLLYEMNQRDWEGSASRRN